MLLPDKDGIRCDSCNTIYKDHFTYYSVKLLEVMVDVDRKMTTEAKEVFDMDLCSGCYQTHIKDAQENAQKPVKQDHINCLNCGEEMTGSFKWYVYNSTEVMVDRNNEDEDARLQANDNHTHIPWCAGCFGQMKETATKNKQVKGDWS